MISIQQWDSLRTKCFNIRIGRFKLILNRQFTSVANNYMRTSQDGKYLGLRVELITPFRFNPIGDTCLGRIKFFLPSIYTLNEMLRQRKYYKDVYKRLKNY